MSAEIISPSSTSPEMSSATCGPFLSVEFTIFLFVFLAGLVSNVLFISVSFKRLVNVKGYSHKPNVYLVHWCIANLILLVFNMPFDVISFSASGFWFFGEDLCRLHFYVERSMYFVIATQFLNMIRDAYEPFGFPNRPPSVGTNWLISMVFMFPLILTSLLYTKKGCTRCLLAENSFPTMGIFQWSEQLYVAVLPLVAIAFYNNKYGEHPDFENQAKAGPDDMMMGTSRKQLRSMCLALAAGLFICTSPARFTEISGGDFENWPGRHIIFYFVPRLLIYGQTIMFTVVCGNHIPTFYQGSKLVAARLWGYRQLPDKIVIEEGEKRKELELS